VIRRFLSFFKIVAVAAFFGMCALIAVFLVRLPDVSLLNDHFPSPRDLEKRQALELSKNRPARWISGKSFSPYLKKAILISEDDAFYQHEGIDWNQLRLALEERFEEGGRLRGASTITQQVAKNLYLSSEKSYLRKLKEALIARSIERELSKDRILEIYLNIVEFGQGIYGAPAAARFYFSKSATELTPKEASFLAMLLPNPKKYSVSFRKGALTKYAADSIQRILLRMRQVGWISHEEYNAEVQMPLAFEKAALEARAEEVLRVSGDFREMDEIEAEMMEDHARGEFDAVVNTEPASTEFEVELGAEAVVSPAAETSLVPTAEAEALPNHQ